MILAGRVMQIVWRSEAPSLLLLERVDATGAGEERTGGPLQLLGPKLSGWASERQTGPEWRSLSGD